MATDKLDRLKLAFLKIESAVPIQFLGSSLDPNHRDWIDVISFRIPPIVAVRKDGPKPDAKAKTALRGISITKLPDRSSAALIQAIASNTTIKRMILHVVMTGSGRKTDVESEESWWEFFNAQVISVVNVAPNVSSGSEILQIDEVSFVFESATHRVGAPKPETDNWFGEAAKPAAGTTALATHMLRQYQTRLY